jgi:hypothetical protein
MIGHDRPFFPRGTVRGQALARHFIIVNPGPVPPFTGTIVPPFSAGGTVHTNIVGSGDRLVIRSHRFALGMFPDHDQRHRFHRFRGRLQVERLILGGETELPDQVETPGDTREEVWTPAVEATPPNVPLQSAAGPAAPTWRSGRLVLTGTLEAPHIIFVGPARESSDVPIFTPGSEPQGKARAPAAQIVEVPTQ